MQRAGTLYANKYVLSDANLQIYPYNMAILILKHKRV